MKNTNSNFISSSFGLSWLRASLNVAAFACASLLVFTSLADAGGAQGARVRRGNVSFSQDGNRLIVRASNGAIIEYDRLSVEAGQIMQFIQPGSRSRVLNRVTGSELTRIDGTLLSNGIVYLVNPQGFRIGNGAVISVGGFFAAAGAMSNNDFLAGRDRFTNLTGQVTNEGLIQAQAVALVGQYVANRGTIDVGNGYLAMGAGDSVVIQKGTGPVMVTVSRSQLGADGSGSGTQAAISNTGTINAGKGSVSMASGDFYALAMDLSGSIIGKSIAARGGKDGVVAVNGTLDASSSTGKGGTIDVFGDRVGLFGNALVNANGATGGGSVRIGGDYLGTNAANAPQANRTVIGTDARITANATQSGDGGRVIVWSNEYTGFFGTIEASAAGTGKGGFIETSSHDNLQAFGSVDASSALGQAGTWLLDPSNVLITNATANGAFGGGNPDTFTPSGNSATVNAATISSTLSAGTDVIILTASGQPQAGNITMTTGVTMSGGVSATLTLNAVGSINLSADITATAGNNLNVVLLAGSTVTLFNAITTQAGNLTITANGAVNVPGVMSIGGTTSVTAGALNTVTFNNNNNFVGAVSIVSGSDVVINDVNGLVLGASNVTNSFNVTATTGDITNTGALLITGAATFTADGAGASITLNNAGNDFSGSVAFNGAGGIANVTVVDLSAFDIGTSNFSGNLSITAGGNITSSGPLTIGGTTLASAAGFDVTLGNAANNFTGAVSTTGANVTIVDVSGLILGASTVSGTFDATATTGDITNTGALAITGAATFTASAAGASISVNNAANSFGAAVAFAGAGGLANVTVVDITAFDIQALTLTGALSVTAGGAITNTGALVIGGTTLASASGFNVTLANAANDFTGAVSTTGAAVSIVDANGLILGGSTVSGTFAATATAGNITNTGALLITGAATFTADGAGASISVNNAANSFGAAVAFAGAGGLANVTVVDTTAFDIQALTLTGALSVTAGGAITNTGALVIGGTTLASASGFNVTLANAANDFTGAVSASGLNVTLNDINAIVIGASTVTGNLDVTSAGNVTQTAGVLAVTGTTTLTPGAANSVTLNSANQFGGAVSVTTATNVSITDASGLALGAISATGTLGATATTGNITNTGALIIGGVATFTASAVGADITVNNGGNDFTSAVLFGGAGLRNVTVSDVTAFDIGASTLSGNLSVTAGGAITNSGALLISGTTTASAAGFDVDLDFATNNFTGAVSTTGANVTIVDVSGLILGASTVSGTFDATATTGDITNTGALAITGAATFTASAAGASISVNNAANSFGAAVAFAGAGGLANVTVVDITAFDIQALTLTGALSVTAGGAITNTGALVIGGTTLASASGFNVTLANAANDFTGAVSTTGAAVSIVDANGLILGGSTVSGTFAATATAGNITNTGALLITGAATFTADGAGASISVNNAANSFGAAVAFAGTGGLANVTVVDTTAFDIQALTLTGALSVTAGGAITNTGALVIGGTTLASASGFNVTLANAANDFTGAVSTTGAAVSIVDANGLILGGSTVSGTFAATATAGNITNTGALLITGAATFTANAAAANISVNNVGNDFASSVSFVGAGGLNNVTVVDLSAFDIGASNLTGNLSITSGGAVTDSGALIIIGTTTVTATGFDVTLNNANNFGGAVSASGANVTLNDINAILLGASTVSGNLVVTNAGNVTQAGVLAVTGTTTLTPGAANSVTLNSANQFGGAVSVTTATNVSLTDASGLVLGAITASGTLGATATTGNITNTGALLISGVSTFTAASGADITLNNAGNNFVAAVAFVASAGTLANVTVTDLSAFDLQALTLTGNLIVTAGGAVTDSGILTIGGTTIVTARGFGVTLNQLGTLGGLVSVNTSGISGIGGDIVLTSTASFSVQSLVTDGFDNPAGAGFNGGNITLDAGVGNSVTLTGGGNITTIGGDASAGAGGDGGDVTFLVNAIIGGSTTVDLSGGTGTPNGTAGTLTFFSTIINGTSTFLASVNLGNVTVTANSDVTVFGTLTLGTVTGGNFDLILSVEDLVLTGAVNNLANLTIQNRVSSGAINIATSTVGALNLSQAEWSFINAATVTNVFLGNTTSYAGTITNLAWINNTNLTTDFLSGGGGSWHVDGNISGTGSITLHGSGGTTFLNTAFMTQANFNLNDSFLLQVLNCVLTSTNASGVNIRTTGFAAGISAQFQNSNLTFNTSAAAATFIFNGDFTSNGGEFINNFTLISGPIASPGTANINLSGQITGALLISRASALSLSSASTLGFILATFTAGSVTINSGIATTLNANSTFITSGNISFGGTLNGARNLSLTAGAGDITFTDAVGNTAALRVITIASARNVTASSSITADSFVQSAGSGTTTFVGTQIYSQAAGLNVTNQAIALNSGVNTAVAAAGGIVTLNATLGSLAINSAGDINSDGAVNLTGVGGISTGGNVLTSGDVVNYNSATTLSGNILVTTGAGVVGDINFLSTLDGGSNLDLTAGTGNITFTGVVGATRLGDVTVSSGATVLASQTFTAASFRQVAGTVATTFAGLVNLTGAFDFTGQALSMNGVGSNVVGTTMEVTNAGLFTTANGANISTGGAFTQNGAGLNSLGGNITTTDDVISFATGVTLTSGILMNTVSVGGGSGITFTSTIDGPQSLGLTAGTGNIVFGGVVGATRLGAITITSANNVTAVAITAASLQQVAGTGTTTFNGAQNYNTIAGLNVVTGGTVALNSTVATTNSGTVTLTGTTAVTIAAAGGITSDGAVNFTSTGGISTAGDVTTTNDVVNYNSATTLTGNVLVNTGAGIGNINYFNTLNGTFDLGLTAGTGNILFAGAVGAVSALGNVTVTSATNVTFNSSFAAASYTQTGGTGDTTYDGLLNLSGAFSFIGNALTLNGIGNNVVGSTAGGMTVTNAGLFTTANGANLTVGNAFVQNGTGLNSIGGNIASTNDGIAFATGVTLTNGVTMTTGAGAGDNIVFGTTLNGNPTLGLTAGLGNITFAGAVGGIARLGAVTVTSGATVLASSTFTAASFTQSAGSVATTFTGLVNLSNQFAFTGTALNMNGSGANVVGTTATVTNSGLFTTANGANLTVGNAFVQNGAGLNSIGGNIASTNDGISFATGVTLTNGVTMTTGAGAGDNIVFSTTLNGTAAGVQTLALTAGLGNITFTGAVGATRLGAVTINSAATVLASSTFTAASFTQSAGSVATTFTGLVDLTNQFAFTGTALNLNGSGANVVGTTATVTNSGLFTTANGANLTVGNAFVQNGAGLNSIGGNIASTNDGIAFATGVTLTNGVTMTTGAGAGDNIVFGTTLNGNQTLGLTAGTGDITFTGAVGGIALLGAVTVTSGATVLASSTFTAASFTQSAGTVATSFTGLVNLTNQFDFTGQALNMNAAGANVVGTTMDVTNAGLFTTAIGANLTVGNDFTQDGAGLNSIGGNIASTNDGIAFATGVTLTNGVTMTTGAVVGDDISFGSTLNGTGAGAQTLDLTAGAGNITFTGAVGAGTRLGAVTVTSGATVLASSTFTAASFTQAAGTVATTFTGLVNLTNQFDFTGQALSMNGVGSNVVGTSMDVTNAGLFTTAIGANLSVGNEFTQDGAGLNSIGGNIASTNDGIAFATGVTLTNSVLMTTGLAAGDDISFGSTLTGAAASTETLGLTAGAGDIAFTGAVGATRLGAITITSANNVTAVAITAASLQQVAGTGTTTFNGAQDYNAIAGLNVVTGGTVALNSTVTTTASGTVTLTGTTAVIIATAGDITSDGAVNFTSTGGISTAGDVTTTNDVVNYNSATTLTGNVLVNTGAGIGNINYFNTLNGTSDLGLTAGTGNVLFTGAVGFGTRLGAITVFSATNVSVGTVLVPAAMRAASFAQSAGTGTTLFSSTADLTNQFAFTGNNLTMNGVGSNVVGTTMTVTNAGLFTTANGANISTGGEFTQNGAGLNSLGGNIASTNDGIAFATGVTLTNSVLMTTGLAAGDDISFGSTLTGAAASTQTLGLTAGAGDIAFTGAVGATRLGAITITSANNVTAVAITAASLQQVAGTGTTTFNGAQDYNAIAGLNVVTGGTIALNNTVATTNSGTVTLTGTTAVTIAVGGDITSDGAVNLTSAVGGISTAGDVTTSGDVVNYNSATTLTGNVLVNTGAGIGNINYFNTLNGTFDLGLTAGTGNILFAGAVGAVSALGNVTVTSATNVTFNSSFAAASYTQTGGTGDTTYDGLLNLSGAFSFIGNALTLNGIGNNVVGSTAGGMTVTNAGLFTTANGANLTVGNAFVQNGTGLNSIGGNIASTNDGIAFATGVTLTNGVTMTTGAGAGDNIVFGTTLNGNPTLGLTAGLGNITFAGAVGGIARLGAVTVTSGATVLASSTFTAASFTQSAGSVATTFTGLVNLSNQFAFTGTALNMNGSGANVVGTTATVTNSGLFTTANGANLTVGNAFVQNGAGLNSIGGNIASTNDGISFATGVTLTNGVTMTTGAGAGDNIVFSTTLNGTAAGVQTLALTAGLGNITFTGAVGATRLGAVTINSAATVLASSTFTAASFTQSAGSVATTFTGLVDLTNQFAFTGTALNLNGSGANVVGTTATVTNSGLFTTANGANLTVGNAFVQNGAGLNSIGGNIASTNDGIAFATGVTLTNGVTMTTGAGAGDNIVFGTTLNGNQTLGLTAGTGDITFTGAVGGIALLGAVTVTSGATVLASSTFTAASFTQSAGTVATSFTGLVNLTNQFDFTGQALNMNAAGANVVGTTMDVTNAGLFTTAIGANLTVGNDFTQDGAGLNSIGGNIASTNDGIAFATGVTLTNGVTMTTGAVVGDDISFGSTLNGTGAGAQTLDLTAGAGNITFTGAVGAGTRLGAVTVTSGATVLASSTFTAASFTQAAGTVATTFTGLVNLTNQFDFTGQALSMNGVGSNVVGTSMDVTNAGLFTTAIGANLSVGNEFTQDGAGLNSIGGNIASTNDGIAFATGVTLTNSVLMTTGLAAGDDISFGSTLTGAAASTETLGLTAGAGDIAFTGAVGATRLGAITITSANNVTAVAITAASLQQVAGTGTTTFNGAQDYNAIAGLNVVTGGTVALNSTVTTTASGTVTLTGTTAVIIAAAGDITSDGAVNFTSTGGISTAGDVTTTNDVVNYNSATTLTGNVLVNTGAGIGNINYFNTLNGTSDLGLTAGTGNVLFTGAVGFGTRLGAITVFSATNVSVGTVLVPAAMRAASFAQSAGTGTTLFSSTADLTNQFAFTGNNLTMNGVGSNVVGTTMTVTNAGLFTTANGANISTGGEFTQNGAGLNSLGGNIASTNDGIAFATGVTLTNSVLMTTGLAAGDDISFGSTLTGAAASTQTLGLTAGAGDIAFTGAVGATRLGAITITSANNVTAVAITAASLQQVAGTGTTTFNGAQDYNAIAGLNVVTGGTIALNNTVATTNSGTVTLTGTTAVTIAVGGDITSDGAVNLTSAVGGISTAGDVTTSGDVVNYNNATNLTGPVAITTGAGAGDINFRSTLDGGSNLDLTAGTGNILFAGAVGGVTRLGTVNVNSGATVLASSTFTAASFTQLAGTVATTFNDLVNLTSQLDFTGQALTLNGQGTNLIGGFMDVANTGLFTLADGANLDLGSSFIQFGPGNNLVGGNIVSASSIFFSNQVTLQGVDAVLLDAATSISFGDPLTPLAPVNILGVGQDLTMVAGTDIYVSGNIGAAGSGGLGAIRVTTANDSTYQGTINADSLIQVAGTGTTTFNGAQRYNAVAGLNVRSAEIALNSTVTTLVTPVGGTVTLFANAGDLTIASGADISSDGVVNLTGFTGINTGGNVLTTGKDVNYNSSTTLTDDILVTTGALGGGDISFFGNLDGTGIGTENLGLTAGAGNILFEDVVGFTAILGAVNVTSAQNVDVLSDFNALSFTQVAGTGLTTFDGIMILNEAFDFTGNDLTFLAAGNHSVGTTMDVTNAGLFTTAIGANLTVVNSFTQDGAGSNSLGGSIRSIDDSISFLRDVTLTAGITMTSGGGLGDVILFSSTVDGTTDDAQALYLTAGLGSITFQDAVGSNVRLGEIVVINALDATFNSTVSAFAFTQLAGTGTTTFAQLFDLTNNFEFTGNNLTVNGVGDNTVGTSMEVENAGLFTTEVGSNLVAGGRFDQFGTGANSIGGDITSITSLINFDSQVELTNDVVMTSGLGLGDDISFGSTIDGEYDLVVTAGVVDPAFASTGGDVTFGGNVGSFEALRSLTVISADTTTHFFADVTTVGDQTYTGGASIDANVIFTATDTLANITFNGAINNGGILPSDMFVDAGGNVIFNGNIGAVSALGTFTVDSGNDLGETITFGAFGSGFFDPTANFEVSAESVQLNTGATSTLAAPATIATIASQSDVGITFVTDDFAMGHNHKLTSYGDIEIVGLTLPSADTVTLGDVNAVGDFTVVSDVIQLLARSGGPILTNTGGTTNDPMVDVVVGGRVYFSTAPVEIGTGKRAAFSNPTGNVDGWGTLGNYAKTVYPSAITRSLLTGLGGEVLDLSASSGVSYTNPATLVPSPMPILPAIGILGNSDTLDEAKDKEKAKAVEDSTKKTASESNPEPTGVPVASR